MKVGGWTRIWIVLCVLYAFLVAVIAFSERPTAESIYSQWFSDASDTIASAISAKENQYVSSLDVENHFFNKGITLNIEQLERIEKKPKLSQLIFSDKIGQLNNKYRRQLANLPRKQTIFWLQSAGWWIGGCGLLYLFGWTIGWVARGFRRAAA